MRTPLACASGVVAALLLALAPAAGAQPSEDPGTIVFDSDGFIFSVTADGDSEPQVVEPADHAEGDYFERPAERPALSPDGTRIAFARKVGDHLDIWTMGIDGSDPRRLTWSATDGTAPAWSPDGRRIAFAGVRSGKRGLYVMSAAGVNLRRVTTGTHDRDPAWSPNGRRIAFASMRSGDGDIYSVKPDGRGLRRVTASSSSDSGPAWSPDGKRIAFVAYTTDLGDKAYVVRARGGGRRLVSLVDCADGECYVEAVAWSPDGKTLGATYFHETDWEARIVGVRPDGDQFQIMDFGSTIGSLSWS